MKNLSFFLLDVSGETTPEGSEIRLWGVDSQGKDVLVIDKSFRPHFYAIPKQERTLGALSETVASWKIGNDDVQVSVEQKRLFNKEVRALRIACRSTDVLEKIAKRLSKHEQVERVLGDDLRYSSLYLLDKGVTPCRWNEVQVQEFELPGTQVDDAYVAVGSPHPITVEKIPKLRILAFSSVVFAEKGSPHARHDPVSAISVATNDGHVRSFVRSDTSDRNAIAEFVEFLGGFDPHIVARFDSNRVIWPYLIERARETNITLAVSKLRSQPHTSVYGHVSIAGRASMDLLDYANELPEVKVKSLQNVTSFLGIKLQPVLPDELQLASFWKTESDRALLVDCAVAQARALLEMAERFLEFGMELSSLTYMPLDQVATASVGHRVDSYLIKQALHENHLIPHRSEQTYARYQGAIVLAPHEGLHDNVIALDFASMYPSLMILYNLSPDTLVTPGEEIGNDACWIVEGLRYRFRKAPPGLYKNALTNLISLRNTVKARLRSASLSDSERRILHERERAVKVIANACYGYAGWTGARWYVREVAESAAALGRSSILRVIDRCKEVGLPVIYADTDAVFVVKDQNKVDSLVRWVNENLHMDIRPDKAYKRVLFTEAKKKYAGLLEDGSLDIVGMEVVRGDWSEIARKVQEKVIELVLRDASPTEAKDYVLNTIDELRRGSVTIPEVVIWKSLSKPIEEYNVRAPHVEVAKKYLSAGRELLPGDKIGYVITKKGGKLYEKAQPYFAVTPDQVDVEYYVSNQIVPAAARILEVFKIGQDQLMLGRQRSLL